MPGWAWALIAVVVAVPVTVILLIAAVTLLGRNATGYPDDAFASFHSYCTQSGASSSRCACAFHVIQDNVSYDEWTRIDRDLRVNNTPFPGWLELRIQRGCVGGT